MRIVHITSEYAPIAKVGGLADVASGLSLELKKSGIDIEVILPKYSLFPEEFTKALHPGESFTCLFDKQSFENQAYHTQYSGIPLTLLDNNHPKDLFKRRAIYGEVDDMERFLYFCKAAVTYLLKKNDPADIIHLHDWPTAAIAPLLHHFKALKAKVVFTIHNLEHQGLVSHEVLHQMEPLPSFYLEWHAMQDPKVPHLANLLKGGITFSQAVTTVSPSYKEEILTPLGGRSLDLALKAHPRLHGILNGLDTAYWNPKTDPYLKEHYHVGDIQEEAFPKKAANKSALLSELQMADEGAPLVGVITRLVSQKGPHLIEHALYRTLEQGGSFILLGSSPVREIDLYFRQLAKALAGNPLVKIILESDERLAHQIYAAADFFLVPSLFEPCGLTQLIAMRYGAIPIVRETGGLKDTVHDIEYSTLPVEERNGYTFKDFNIQGVNSALDRALSEFHDHTRRTQLIRQGMRQDFSWRPSAEKYLTLYRELSESR
ncbi:MAG: glycogen synthase [Chlamydiales bacterium]|jgi:starch synthase|nr:glycogen synthase [Chlamydiales bacterium]